MPFLVVCAAASADRRGEGFAAHVEFRKVYRVIQRFVPDAGSLSIPADVGRLRGIRDETVAIDTMTLLFIEGMKHIGLHHARAAVTLLGECARLVCTGSMDMADVDVVLMRQFGQIGRLDEDRNAGSFQLSRTNASTQPSTDGYLKAGLVQILTENLKGLLGSTELESVGHVENADLGRHMRSYLMTKNIIGFALPR